MDPSILELVAGELFTHDCKYSLRFSPSTLIKLNCNRLPSIIRYLELDLDLQLMLLESWEISNTCVQNTTL